MKGLMVNFEERCRQDGYPPPCSVLFPLIGQMHWTCGQLVSHGGSAYSAHVETSRVKGMRPLSATFHNCSRCIRAEKKTAAFDVLTIFACDPIAKED